MEFNSGIRAFLFKINIAVLTLSAVSGQHGAIVASRDLPGSIPGSGKILPDRIHNLMPPGLVN